MSNHACHILRNGTTKNNSTKIMFARILYWQQNELKLLFYLFMWGVKCLWETHFLYCVCGKLIFFTVSKYTPRILNFSCLCTSVYFNIALFNLHVADGHVDRSIGVKKPRYSADEGPSLTELSGYNSKRHEFDPEYDNDAEQALAEMEFKETDSETDRELKLRVLRIYLSRLVNSADAIILTVLLQ